MRRPEAWLGPVRPHEEECEGRQPTTLTCRPHGMCPGQRCPGYRNRNNKLACGIGCSTPYLRRIIKVHEHHFIQTEPIAMYRHTRRGRSDLLREPDTWANCLGCTSGRGVETQPGGQDDEQ